MEDQNLLQIRLLRKYARELRDKIANTERDIRTAQQAIANYQQAIKQREADTQRDMEAIGLEQKRIAAANKAKMEATSASIELAEQLRDLPPTDDDDDTTTDTAS